ncbi:MAG TPA: SMC family ATPase, partial [Bacteroidales bacterium]|nr:SMC family ATPase [Bacteroidales bacterium]
MVPISLSLQGFYSYKDKQTIDFNSLTKAGVFGIFGQTGAGKSAIIEAIMLALYGDIERINNREERSYNVMNLQSKELFIEFICFSHITQTKYTITVKAKRSSKNFEQVSKLDRICYKLVDSKWIPINLEDIQKEITCLSYNNFKQTVIIPQGKFMEFLQLSPTERTGMLKDLFNLHEYELSEKVKIVEGEIIQQKSRIEGNIQEIGEIDETVLATIQQKENELLTLGIEQKKQLDTLQENLKKLYLIKQDFDEFEKTKLIHKELLSKEQEFKELEKTISLISLCVKYIAPIYDTLQLKQNDAGKLQSIITNAKQEFQKIEIRFNESKKIFEELEQKFIQLPEFKQNTNFIKQCYELKNVEKQIETQTLKQQEFAKKIETLEKTQKTNEYSLQEQKELRKQLQQNVPDISSIYKQKHELEKYNTICNRIEECREKRIQYEHEIQTLKQQVCDSAFTV